MITIRNIILIGFIFVFFYFAFSQSRQEGFVKYYQSAEQEKQAIAAENDDKRDQSSQYVTNSRKNLERTFSHIGNKNSDYIPQNETHDGVIDVLELRSALVSSLIPQMNEAAIELTTNSEYSLSGKPQDIVVQQSASGDKKFVKATVEIHDTSLVMWTGYTTSVRLSFWLVSSRVILVEANIMERNKDKCMPEEKRCPASFDKAQVDAPEELLSSVHLVYPWDTTEQKTGLAISDAEGKEELARRKSKATEENFYCFGVVGQPPSSAISRDECTRRGGTVDAPVYDQTRCKFYMSNGNYPNQRGGSKYGYCEAPLGMVNLSFSRWDPNPSYAPLCYNCKAGVALNGKEGGLGPCCEDQKANLSEYNLLTPDYAFPGDMFDRRQFATNFKKRGLSWHRFGKKYEESLRK